MVSIVIPTYNRANVLPATLDSVIAQTYGDWECIIVDDGSVDNTMLVVEKYQIKDERIIYVKNSRKKGAQGARNTGILLARGEWVCLFDSDDIMYPNYLEVMIANAEINIDVLVCQADIFNIKTDKKIGVLDKIKTENTLVDLLNEKIYIAYDVTLIKLKKLLEINLLDENCPSMQEWDTHIRLSKVAIYKPIYIPLCEWRMGGEDTITNDSNRHIVGRIYIYMKHQFDFRRYAYRHFLNSLFLLIRNTNKRYIYLRVPELFMYIILKKTYKFIYDIITH